MTIPPPTSNDPHPGPRTVEAPVSEDVAVRARRAQAEWATVTVAERLRIVRRARRRIAASAIELAASVPASQPSSLHRNQADTLVAEVLPLAEACRFLEREAAAILRTNRLGGRHRPLWLQGVESEVYRVPLGLVLIVAPSNYPLFLPGVQALQAIVAGNAVLWKPAAGGEHAARLLLQILLAAGLPEGVLQVIDCSVQSGIEAIRHGVDKIFLTGHADTGRAVMHEAADALTPSVMELSGCDAVFVLPGAALNRVAHALAFGMRLNGSATCMAPRCVFASETCIAGLLPMLLPMLDAVDPVTIAPSVKELVNTLIRDSNRCGSVVVREGRDANGMTPTVVANAAPDHAILHTDVFAPLLTFCAVTTGREALEAHTRSPYALTAAVFGPEKDAIAFANQLRAGTVLINDLIVSTADPRVPFGGRGASGFGVTRGREGLLEMTAVKTVLRQTSRSLRPYAVTGRQHLPFFKSFIEVMHGASFMSRIRALRQFIAAARNVENSSPK